MTMNVNISGKQLNRSDFVDEVRVILKETGLASSALRLEITECIFQDEPGVLIDVLSQLKRMGVDCLMDDPAMGYPSLSKLENLPIRTIKIDRGFISTIQPDSKPEVLDAIMKLVHNLNLIAIAEGIETEYQMAELRQLGCQYGQGYLFFQPLEQTAAERLLTHSVATV